MVNNLGLLAESDFEMNQSQENGQSHSPLSTVTTGRRPKSHPRKDIHMRGSSSNDEESEHDGSQHSPRQNQRVEQDSPQ